MKIKTLLILFILLYSSKLSAQGYSTINFITNGLAIKVYLNERLIGSMNKFETLEYKVFSKGRLSIIVVAGNDRAMTNVDIKEDSTYYFVIPTAIFMPKERALKYMAKSTTVLHEEEDPSQPLIVSNNNSGPKQGTCFLIGKQGYLLTNYHVISGAKAIQVKGVAGDFSTLYGVDVVAYDVDLDLALLKFKNPNLTFEPLPYFLSLETNPQGTKSFVLGYPLTSAMGEEIKVTEGLVSSKSGYKGSISQYQFSAAIQPGNSGSPLFNDKGDIIGVINAKLSGAEGAGYAIKSQYALTFLKLIDNIQIEANSTNSISTLSLTDKISKLKNNIFIVKTE